MIESKSSIYRLFCIHEKLFWGVDDNYELLLKKHINA